MVDVFLAFDTEDPIHTEADDALLRLARTLSDAGVPGNFFLVGEKARLLRERGRRDVLAALADHEIDYHGNWWYEFPENALEYGDRLDWDEAVDYATRIELPGLHDVAEITGRWPVAWVQHQNNVHAMLPHVFRRLGLRAWNGGFGSDPLRGWLMDQVVLTRHAHRMSLQGSWRSADHDPLDRRPAPAVMDPEVELRAFQEQFDRLAAEQPAVVPLGHPTCWVMAEWWGWYEWDQLGHWRHGQPYPRGRQFRRVALRDPADREAHFAWTKRAVEWLAARSDVRVTTFGEYADRVAEPGLLWLTLTDLDTVAAAVTDGPRDLAVAGTTLAAADVLGCFAHLFATIEREGRLPDLVPVQRLLGPVEAPTPAQPVTVARASWLNLAPHLTDYCVTQRRIPGALRSRVELGPAAATMVFARAWQGYRATGAWPAEVAVTPPGDLPTAADLPFFRAPTGATSHATPGFQPRRLADLVRWQSWSYRDFVTPR